MEKFNFKENEHITFFWRLSSCESLTSVKAVVKEIEETEIWFEFAGEEDESFVIHEEMHLNKRNTSIKIKKANPRLAFFILHQVRL